VIADLVPLITAIFRIFYKPFLVISFDPILAATLRLPTNLLRSLLLILLALTVVVSMQSVGVGLVAAMLITPAATAYLLTKRLSHMMFVSAGIGALSSLTGLYTSYYLNIASGAAIVLAATLIFLVVYFLNPAQGVFLRLKIAEARKKR